MQSLYGKTIFSVGEQVFAWEDVELASKRWGEWAILEQDVRRKIACRKQVRATGVPFGAEVVDEAAFAFRQSRGLDSDQDMDAWLASVQLSPEQWIDHIVRTVLVEHFKERLDDLVLLHPAADAEIEPLLSVEALCSGDFDRWVYRLASQAACEVAAPSASDEAGSQSPEQGAPSIPGLAQSVVLQKLQRLERMERAFVRFCAALATESALDAQVSEHRRDWIHVRCLSAAFTSEALARNAVQLVRKDRLDFRLVAARAEQPAHEMSFHLEDVPPQLAEQFVVAHPGDLLGPFQQGPLFVLHLVQDKAMPSLDDPQVRQAAEANLVEEPLSSLVEAHVVWR